MGNAPEETVEETRHFLTGSTNRNNSILFKGIIVPSESSKKKTPRRGWCTS